MIDCLRRIFKPRSQIKWHDRSVKPTRNGPIICYSLEANHTYMGFAVADQSEIWAVKKCCNEVRSFEADWCDKWAYVDELPKP